jgi:hypothetical protein
MEDGQKNLPLETQPATFRWLLWLHCGDYTHKLFSTRSYLTTSYILHWKCAKFGEIWVVVQFAVAAVKGDLEEVQCH